MTFWCSKLFPFRGFVPFPFLLNITSRSNQSFSPKCKRYVNNVNRATFEKNFAIWLKNQRNRDALFPFSFPPWNSKREFTAPNCERTKQLQRGEEIPYPTITSIVKKTMALDAVSKSVKRLTSGWWNICYPMYLRVKIIFMNYPTVLFLWVAYTHTVLSNVSVAEKLNSTLVVVLFSRLLKSSPNLATSWLREY